MKRSEDGKCFEDLMRAAAERITKMERHLEEVEQRNTHLRNAIWDISARIVRIEEAGIKFFEHLEIRSRKPSAEDTTEDLINDEAIDYHKHTRRPSFIHTEEASQDIHNHLNKWKEGKKLQRIRRDSEMWEERFARSYSNCSNRNSDKIRTSADSSDDIDSEVSDDCFSNQRAQSCADLVVKTPKSDYRPTPRSYDFARRPSLPVHLPKIKSRVKYERQERTESNSSNKRSPNSTKSNERRSRTPKPFTSDSSDSEDSAELRKRRVSVLSHLTFTF